MTMLSYVRVAMNLAFTAFAPLLVVIAAVYGVMDACNDRFEALFDFPYLFEGRCEDGDGAG